jgi:hypothetical protein
MAGDFNVDFTKPSRNCAILDTFMQTFDLCRGDSSSDITFTYRRDDHQSFSWVDHIICSSAISSSISSVTTSDSVDNFSDHLPVFFTLKSSTFSLNPMPALIGQSSSISTSLSSRINWSNITEENISNFQRRLQNNLPRFSSVNSCVDSQCSDHKDAIDHYCNQLLQAIDQAAQTCFPKTLSRRARLKVPGWNDKAKSLREKAIFWAKIWKDCGCPSSGVLSIIEIVTRMRFDI